MQEGDLVTPRFRLVSLAGRGGMGEVWRADDLERGGAVALKFLLGPGVGAERFAREAELLASVEHPALVRYVAHGAGDGRPWLAMRWIAGPSLEARLATSPLDADEALAVSRRIASALAALHARGIVHRDVKPSNVALDGGDPSAATLLDLGIARPLFATEALTGTNLALGTIGYMAPEQARGERDVDARADVFALGALLYECLAGEPAFGGDNAIAVLSALLCDPHRPLAAARPDLPPRVHELVDRMLAKDRAHRPRDAAAVLSELGTLELPSAQRHAAPVRRAARLSEVERQLSVAAVVTLGVIDAVDATVDASSHAADLAVARAAAARVGGDAVPLAGGSLLVLVEARGTAADQATMSVRVVRAIVDALPRAHAGIAAGLSAAAAKGLAGDLLARALGLAKQGPGIHVDRAVADLLGGEHAMAARGDGFELAPTKDAAVDRVLGRVLPFVGRDKEMALLEAVVAEASDEGAPRSALVLAPPGTGKSRLGRELAARLRAKEHVALLETVAHATEAGAVHSLLAGLVRSAAKLGAKPHAGDRDRMRLYVASLPGIEQPSRLTDFLAWMAGWRALDDGAGPELVAAVGDPDLMARGVRRSLREWLASASRVGTVVLLLEDLHWGDAASIARLDDVMRALPSSPIVLIGLARPEAKETLPLSLHMLTEVRLEGLGARAAERIVRALLGADESAAVVADVVERARGNPLFLGELSRFLREGRGDELPASVHAVIEARISRLSPECRRVLRAASVLGERVTPAAVASVAGEEVRAIDRALATLSETEILRAEETEGTEETHRFVHALVREVAYATLVGDDRARAHARAAAFLEQAAAPDPRAIARHWELAGEPKRAILHLVEAADYAVEVGAERDAFEIAQHGIALGAEGVELGHLAGMMTIQALAANANPTEAARWSEVALDNVPATHETWPLVAGVAAFGAVASGRGAELGARVVRTWLAAGVRVTHNRRHYLSSLILVLGLARSGHRRELAMILASTAEPRKEALAEIATYEVAHCADALYNAGGVGEIDRRIARARSPAQATDDDLVLGFCDYYEARVRGVATLSAGVAHDLAATAERRAGTTYQATLAGIQTAAAIARALTDARAIDAIRPYVESADMAVSDLARYGVVVALIRAGRLDDARRAIAEAEVVAPSARSSLAVQAARITALEGRPADALEELGRVEPLLAEHAFVWQWEYWYATKIQALVDVGRTSDARVALGLARARLAVTLDGASPALVSLAHAAVEPVVALDQLARELDG